MRKCLVVAAGAAMLALSAADARAQWMPLGGRLTVSLNAGAQVGNQDIERSTAFTLYDEPATVDFSQKIESGVLLDIGAALRLRPNGALGVGVTYTALSSTEAANIPGSLPHPLFFDRARSFSVTTEGLDHKEQAVHVNAVWFVPFVEKVDFTISAGPSFFTVTQGFARGVSFSENPPSFDTVTVDSVDIATLEKSAVGFNLGADVTYAITQMIGVGGMIRFTRATADFDLAEGQQAEVKAGGFQVGAGVRVRF
jgi:opacity protein-like surface antigen